MTTQTTDNQPSSADFVTFSVSKAHPTQKQFGTDLPVYIHLFRTAEYMLMDLKDAREELVAKFPAPDYHITMSWRKNLSYSMSISQPISEEPKTSYTDPTLAVGDWVKIGGNPQHPWMIRGFHLHDGREWAELEMIDDKTNEVKITRALVSRLEKAPE